MNAVIFDMDGVIFDSERLYVECCTEAAAELGMAGIVEVCYRCIGVTTETTRQILLEAYRDPALVDRFREKTVSLYLEKYDATDLTIMAVPSTLSNYLDNRYELQYTLYDYLYRNGKSDVETAAVRDFSIDPERRIASISFELDDGSTVTGSYKKDSNSYEYTS